MPDQAIYLNPIFPKNSRLLKLENAGTSTHFLTLRIAYTKIITHHFYQNSLPKQIVLSFQNLKRPIGYMEIKSKTFNENDRPKIHKIWTKNHHFFMTRKSRPKSLPKARIRKLSSSLHIASIPPLDIFHFLALIHL
jgi:hypothetical protein